MQGKNIFGDEKEIKRLKVQNRLFSETEKPLILKLFSGKSGLTVLDAGCNDGSKAFELFSDSAFSRVIGFERDESLVKKANKKFGSEKFSFYTADIEQPDFADICNIKQFDIIYISFVLMHLNDPEKLLKRLKKYLKPNGSLIIAEANDGISDIFPNGKNLLCGAMEILKRDKYAGDREMGEKLPALLSECGYTEIETLCDYISAYAGEQKKKEDMFAVFFSYIPDDIKLLLTQEPENAEYIAFFDWSDNNFEDLRRVITDGKTEIKMGIKLLICKRKP